MSDEQNATSWWGKSQDWFTQVLPYALLVMFVAFGVFGRVVSQNQVETSALQVRQEAQERVAFEQCRSDNDTRDLIRDVLDAISEPWRPGETDAQYQARIDVFEEAKRLLTLNECPIPPPDVR